MKTLRVVPSSIRVVGILVLLSSCRSASSSIGEIAREPSASSWVVFPDKRNAYWFGSDGEGVYRYDGKDLVRYTTRDGLCNDHVRQILEDGRGNVYINTNGGISRFDGRTFATLTPIDTNEWRLAPDDLWFKGHAGPLRYDGATLHRLRLPENDIEASFRSKFPQVPYSPYDIYTIFKDSTGAVWFGTSVLGVCRYDGRTFTWVSDDELTELGLGPSVGVRGIVEDRDGRFWFGNVQHRYAVDPAGTSAPASGALPYRKEPGMESTRPGDLADYVHFVSAFKDDEGDLWLATYGAGVWRYDGKRLTHFPVMDGDKPGLLYSMVRDDRDFLWLGSLNSGVFRFEADGFRRFRP